MFTIDATFTCYDLPADGAAAQQAFLEQLHDPHETYLVAYGFTLPDMIEELLKAHANGVPLHLYLDYTQSVGAAEKAVVKQLVDAGIEVTIGTSPAGSSFICHTKAFVNLIVPIPFCWSGSVNFSRSGWQQVNDAFTFYSSVWAEAFVNRFQAMRDYAWNQERKLQLMPQPPAGVTLNDMAKSPDPVA